MPLRANYQDPEQDFPPAPNAPLPQQGGGAGTNLPGGNPGQSAPVNPINTGGDGGGGGGYVPPALPNYPGIRIPGAPEFLAPKFTAPTMADLQGSAGYQSRLNSGTQALDRSAAARGALRTGGTLNDIMEYGQNFGAQEYQNEFNRRMAAHQAAFQGAQSEFAPRFAQWQERASADKQGQLSRYQTELQNYLQQAAPRGGGGGYEPSIEELVGAPPTFPGDFEGSDRVEGYSAPGRVGAMRHGYPWPDQNYY